MGYFVKKIDAAFGRLRNSRRRVGIGVEAEQSRDDLKENLKSIAQSKDISAIVKLIARSNIRTPAEYIKQTVGSLVFIYYTYIDNFHFPPKDLEQLVDGMLYVDAKNYIQKQAMENR